MRATVSPDQSKTRSESQWSVAAWLLASSPGGFLRHVDDAIHARRLRGPGEIRGRLKDAGVDGVDEVGPLHSAQRGADLAEVEQIAVDDLDATLSVTPFVTGDLRFSTLSLAAPQQRDPGIDLHDLAAVDARLARLCAAWASLPEHVILAIIALLDSTGDRRQPPSRDPRGLRPSPVASRIARPRRPR